MTLIECMELTRKLTPDVDITVFDRNNMKVMDFPHDKGFYGNTILNEKVIDTRFKGFLCIKIDWEETRWIK